MRIDRDIQADAMYVYLLNKPYAYGRDLDDWRRIDYSADNLPIGIELLNVSEGINGSGLPNSEEVASAIASHGIQVYFLDQHLPTVSGSMHSTLIIAEPEGDEINIIDSGESIAIFDMWDIWFDSPIKTEMEDTREVITA
ncbi:MAG: DUF2283 domain-containing protein [Chloroflexota bacterium]|nr:DUF2283 domain-containing protein [Chloroflexota bacterium]